MCSPTRVARQAARRTPSVRWNRNAGIYGAVTARTEALPWSDILGRCGPDSRDPAPHGRQLVAWSGVSKTGWGSRDEPIWIPNRGRRHQTAAPACPNRAVAHRRSRFGLQNGPSTPDDRARVSKSRRRAPTEPIWTPKRAVNTRQPRPRVQIAPARTDGADLDSKVAPSPGGAPRHNMPCGSTSTITRTWALCAAARNAGSSAATQRRTTAPRPRTRM